MKFIFPFLWNIIFAFDTFSLLKLVHVKGITFIYVTFCFGKHMWLLHAFSSSCINFTYHWLFENNAPSCFCIYDDSFIVLIPILHSIFLCPGCGNFQLLQFLSFHVLIGFSSFSHSPPFESQILYIRCPTPFPPSLTRCIPTIYIFYHSKICIFGIESLQSGILISC